MDKIYNFKASIGLPVTFIKKPGFETKYAAIGVRYGSSILKYKENGEIHNLKTGIAHFLEHKLFRMEDGTDALSLFTDLNAFANAFTQGEKTTYYFNTTDEFYKPFSLLLKMFFTPNFNDKDIDEEKNIIISERNETLDDIDSLEFLKELQTLYPNDPFSELVIGNEEDILSTKKEDLYDAYTAFYTPNNSRLLIVGDLDLDTLKEEIEKNLSGLFFSNRNVEILPDINSKDVSKPCNYYSYPNAIHILGRMDDINYSNSIALEAIGAIFDSLFSNNSKFYKSLLDQELIINENIDYTIATERFTSWYSIDIYTNNPNKVIELIIEKLRNVNFLDLNPLVLEKKKKTLIAKSLFLMDSVGKLGAKLMDLLLEDKGYDDLILSIDENDLKEYLPYINNSKITYIVSK